MHNAALIPPALSLYVHIPWCVQKCPYCDFNSHALKAEIPEKEYIDALLEDLDTDIEKYQLNGMHLAHCIRSLLVAARRVYFLQKESVDCCKALNSASRSNLK